ncbi:MAG: hypothetical protein NPIRA06_22950 [Nitrospirales bacterium]|nr:MAG: hypothetical protein NPIRA06_22950 [Nitrospirales bacterium]
MPPTTEPDAFHIQDGRCIVVFAYDVGASIQIDEAEQRITATKERGRIKRKRPAPEYFDYHPPPLRITQELEPIRLGAHHTLRTVDTVLYDFGALMVTYQIPLAGPFASLLPLSEVLYENAQLLEGTFLHIQSLLNTLGPAIEKPNISELVEDYAIFHIFSTQPALDLSKFVKQHSTLLSQILRCEDQPLSEQEICDATTSQIAFGTQDLTLIDWNASLMIGQEMDDVRAVLEFANVELVERRFLDHQLDEALDEAYAALTQETRHGFRWPGSSDVNLRRIAGMQVDSAILFERVTNTLKLFGDQYLARVSRLASQRFHLQSWDTSILRKLDTLDNLYDKMAGQTGNRRMEILEWIIIILIAISILLPFIPGFPGY